MNHAPADMNHNLRHKWFTLYEKQTDDDEGNPQLDIVEAMGVGDHTLLRVTQYDPLAGAYNIQLQTIDAPIELTASRPAERTEEAP